MRNLDTGEWEDAAAVIQTVHVPEAVAVPRAMAVQSTSEPPTAAESRARKIALNWRNKLRSLMQ